MGQMQNLKVVLETVDKKSNPAYLEKAVTVLSAICNASNYYSSFSFIILN